MQRITLFGLLRREDINIMRNAMLSGTAHRYPDEKVQYDLAQFATLLLAWYLSVAFSVLRVECLVLGAAYWCWRLVVVCWVLDVGCLVLVYLYQNLKLRLGTLSVRGNKSSTDCGLRAR